MIGRIWYEVREQPDADDGYNVYRDGLFATWHCSQSEAVMDAIAQAMAEADSGTLTGYRCIDLDGRIRDERTYPRPVRVVVDETNPSASAAFQQG